MHIEKTMRCCLLFFGWFFVLPAGGCVVPASLEKHDGDAHRSAVADVSPFQFAVVGTIHKYHLIQKDYPLQVLEPLIEAFSPDLILVEIRPTPFRKGHLEDGPFEMAYVVHAARKRHISVVPIDWWREAEVGMPAGPATQKQKARFAKAVRHHTAGLSWPPSFAQIHSAAYTRSMWMIINARARILNGIPRWNRRQAWFHFYATEALRKHHPKRVMAFVGAQHRPQLLWHLSALGGKRTNPRTLLKEHDVDMHSAGKRKIPKAVIATWRTGIKRMQARKKQAHEALRRSYVKKIHYFELAVARKGRCCASPKALKSEASKPNASKPNASKPNASKPNASKPNASKPAPAEPRRSQQRFAVPRRATPRQDETGTGKTPGGAPAESIRTPKEKK
jgi:hypothetical protein